MEKRKLRKICKKMEKMYLFLYKMYNLNHKSIDAFG